MLKFLILISVLLNFAACHQNDKMLCVAEAKRYNFCTGIYNNFTRELFESRKELIESSSTIAPLGSQLGGEFKKMMKCFLMKCIGDLECKGERKQIKFQIDTVEFYGERVTEAQECIEKNDINQSLRNCVALHKQFPLPKGTDEKKGLERGARAVADLYDQLDMVFADEEYVKNFDLKFDPRKYGL
ncbi:hypothetical protein L5515_007052 [Caenorhabditis briggsae]|uniref:Uncharacterized protein n=1 Tax=Caenorhabditis briggsae TaxID=6238 RepID=A0AAE9F430_CAEBR|nr:hypothetical protein L5515_007052 [Caenorhabditis briggsae]